MKQDFAEKSARFLRQRSNYHTIHTLRGISQRKVAEVGGYSADYVSRKTCWNLSET
jgi:hypothetical protein